jgi:ABC-type cobalamin/Fe3+-siderophores transport system ATPase subunit
MAEQSLESPTPGSGPAIVEFFAIEGLYGYRTVSLTATYAATVLIARNGAGKTTLIGALDAFLRCQFGRLSNLQFSRIVCQIRGVAEQLVLTSADIEALMTVPDSSEFLMMARRYAVEPSRLLDFIENEFDSAKQYADMEDDEVFKKILGKVNYSFSDARKICERISDSIKGRVQAVDQIRLILRRVLKNVEIVYLPTYRRIELSLGEAVEEGQFAPRRPSIQSRLGLSKKGFFNTDIQFGLADISVRLRELNNRLLFNSNQGYREISAKIINDLLDGTFEREAPELGERPDKESLTLFFSRLKRGAGFMPHFEKVETPDIDKIYNEGASSESSTKFLNYFLSKLNAVIQATRSIERLVEEFVGHCNAYLSAREVSTELKGHGSAVSSGSTRDEKRLEIDRMTLQVSVISVAANRKIPMDSLSSGEKQMISLFARLYLYERPKIVLIDEPELSLSIDWQRKILLDVVSAPTCSQAIAITHSPFVFDNALEPYARALSLKIEPAVSVGPDALGDLFDEGDVDE